MGKKAKNLDQIRVSLIVTGETKSEVERLSKKRKASQQQIFRMLLELGLEVHRDMEKMGVIKAVDFAYYVKKAVREKMEKSGAIQTSII